MLKIIFLDTNIFLHYQSFDQIDWLKIAGEDKVKLIITPVNLRELNSIKDSPARSWFRKRAKAILSKISRIITDENLLVTFSDNVELLIEHRDPEVDFSAYHLDRRVQDDNLIASILMYREEMPEANIALITSDDGITLLAKARPQGISTIRMPEQFRLADEPDPEQERMRELEKKYIEITSAMPNLSLVFEDESQHASFSISNQLLQFDEKEVEKRLNEIKQKYPKKEVLSKRDSLMESRLAASLSEMISFAPDDIKIYNSELENFYSAYENFERQNTHYLNITNRTIELRIWVLNDGTTPAEDIDVSMYFPDGFEMFEQDKLPDPPQSPKPPTLKNQYQRLSEQMSSMSNLVVPMSTHFANIPPINSNVSSPSIKKTNSYDVDINIQKIKHKFQVSLDPLYLLFESSELAKSFHIDYTIVAQNLPHATSGKLHIILKKD